MAQIVHLQLARVGLLLADAPGVAAALRLFEALLAFLAQVAALAGALHQLPLGGLFVQVSEG